MGTQYDREISVDETQDDKEGQDVGNLLIGRLGKE